jgi:NAD(P)-dependent dehydrogenase (short-subunit alcohol dehydrogenase family)
MTASGTGATGGNGDLVVYVGATGAFGAAVVDRLVGEGYTVLAVARDAERLATLADGRTQAVRVCAADIGDDAAVGPLRDAIAAALPAGVALRAVVHGPGVAVAGGVQSIATSALLAAVNIKVGGLLRVVRAADEFLTGGARIIAIAGHYGLEPTDYAAAAGVANAAVFNVVRQLSLAYGGRGVTAHSIAPGPADTERLRKVAADRAALEGVTVETVLAELRHDSSLGRLTSPAEVAWAVSTLLAPEASVMTGSTLMLDAGRRRGLP